MAMRGRQGAMLHRPMPRSGACSPPRRRCAALRPGSVARTPGRRWRRRPGRSRPKGARPGRALVRAAARACIPATQMWEHAMDPRRRGHSRRPRSKGSSRRGKIARRSSRRLCAAEGGGAAPGRAAARRLQDRRHLDADAAYWPAGAGRGLRAEGRAAAEPAGSALPFSSIPPGFEVVRIAHDIRRGRIRASCWRRRWARCSRRWNAERYGDLAGLGRRR